MCVWENDIATVGVSGDDRGVGYGYGSMENADAVMARHGGQVEMALGCCTRRGCVRDG